MNEKYGDIIDLDAPTSTRHKRMPVSDRAAQFAPFAALTGYGEVIDETGRTTDSRRILSEDMRELLDLKQRMLCELIDEQPAVSVTYFVSDKRKSGGRYKTVTGTLGRVDAYGQRLIFTDGTEISVDDIVDIDSPLLGEMIPRDDTEQ